MTVNLRGQCLKKHSHDGRCKTWYYDFCIRSKRYRGAIPEARLKPQAEQAELKIRQSVFDNKFGEIEVESLTVGRFFNDFYFPFAQTNKRSWKNDKYNGPVVMEYFGDKTLDEVLPLDIERMKSKLLSTKTKHGGVRSKASVNRVFELVSSMFSYAIKIQKATSNPCLGVHKFKLDNERFRWLSPAEETELLSACMNELAYLKPLIVISLSTGLRKQELLQLKRNQVDFFRNQVIAVNTKSGRNREIPLNLFDDRTREALHSACQGKRSEDFVFVSKRSKKPFTDIKKVFRAACDKAKIEGLVWHDLRATFATRLAEAGHHAFLIRDLMGHTDSKVTERYVRAAALKQMTRRVS